MFGEREAFEKAIDVNPLEATNHHAYADYLEERGDHDEAAFRRAMGKWMDRHAGGDIPAIRTKASWPWRVFHTSYRYGDETRDTPIHSNIHLPEGVDASKLPVFDTYTDAASLERGPADPTHGYQSANTLSYKTYRGMEGALRKAFTPQPRAYKRIPVLPRRRFRRK